MLAAMLKASIIPLLICASVHGQAPKTTANPMRPDPNTPRPIDAVDSVFLEELTWMEVRDAMRDGKTTVIIATGGIEQNGPYLALGKHNYILRATTEAIARKLGNALVAPVVPFVPEGDIEPPTGHMLYPGTISLRQDTFKALLRDISASFKTHGFQRIILLADSGGNVQGMREVAAELTAKWRGKPAIHYIAEYYDYPAVTKYLETIGVKQTDEGIHDDFGISSIIMTVDPAAVRMKQRMAKNKLTINGVSLAPPKSIELGRKVVEYRARVTVEAIRRVSGN
jgi:creatinine amidohydrolase/Fe(II)-dependent formamide hydrolase-like protein